MDYTELTDRCDDAKLGRSLASLDEIYGYLILPDNSTSEILTQDLKITGPDGIYGKSLLLKNLDTNRRICSSIVMTDKASEKTAIARFKTPIFGNIYFRWFSTKDNHSEMLVSADLYKVASVEKIEPNTEYTEHSWKIYVTDILDNDDDTAEVDCNTLQLVFDPENRGSGRAVGDIDARIGKIKIAGDYTKRKYKTLFRDSELILLPSDLAGPHRRLYVVVFESKHEDSFLACAKIRYDHSINAK